MLSGSKGTVARSRFGERVPLARSRWPVGLGVLLVCGAHVLAGQSVASLAQASGPAADASPGAPRACTVDTMQATFPKQWLGTKIGRIVVVGRNVETPFAPLNSAMHYLHRPTLLGVAEQELRLQPGEPMDSLQVLEAVRRMRRTRLYTDLTVEGTQCGTGETDLTITTRDAFTLRGGVRLSEGGPGGPLRFNFSETNLLGTGRSVALAEEEIDNRRAFSASVVDPYLFGTRLRGAAMLRLYRSEEHTSELQSQFHL